MMEGNDRYETGYQTDQTGVISDTYTDIKQTHARLHNLHGHQLLCCPKAGDITLHSTMDAHRHPYSSSNGVVRTWMPHTVQLPFVQPKHTAPIFLGIFCRVATRSEARASMSLDSHDESRAWTASRSRRYCSILMAMVVTSSLSSRYRAMSRAKP
jgi:hypothetical protein